MKFLLDTNALSEIRRGRDENVAAWADRVDDSELCLSALTVGEVRKGIERLRGRDEAQAEVFERWLAGLLQGFGDRILGVDARVAEEWGRLNATAELPTVDSLIAATARVHGLTVVSRNVADFERSGVALINPWEEPR